MDIFGLSRSLRAEASSTRPGEESNGLAGSPRRNPVQFVAVVSPFPSRDVRLPYSHDKVVAACDLSGMCGSKKRSFAAFAVYS